MSHHHSINQGSWPVADVQVHVPSSLKKQDLRDMSTFSDGQANYGQCASYCFAKGHVGSAIAYNQEGDNESCVKHGHIKCKCFALSDDPSARPEPLAEDDKCRYSQVHIVVPPKNMDKTFLVNDGSAWVDNTTYKMLEELGQCDDEERPDVDESKAPPHCKTARKPFNCLDYDEVMLNGSSAVHKGNLTLYDKVCPMDAKEKVHSYRKTDRSNNFAPCASDQFVSDIKECKKAYQFAFKDDMNGVCDKMTTGCQVRQVGIRHAPTGCIYKYDHNKDRYIPYWNVLKTNEQPGDTSEEKYGALCRKP